MIIVLVLITLLLVVLCVLLARHAGELRQQNHNSTAVIVQQSELTMTLDRLNVVICDLAELMQPRELVVAETEEQQGCCGGACAPVPPVIDVTIGNRPADDPDPAAELAASVPVFTPTREQMRAAEQRRMAAEARNLTVDEL